MEKVSKQDVTIDYPNGDRLPANSQPLTANSLMTQREKMIGELNTLKSNRETLSVELKNYEASILRTEGGIMLLNTLIQEIDPALLQQGAR